LLFGDEWILKLTLREEWLVEQGKLEDEPTTEARKRQRLREFQHSKVHDWLKERRITYLWEFEQAFAREFPDSRTTEASSPPSAAEMTLAAPTIESALPTDTELEEWYIRRVNEWPPGKPPPDRVEDVYAAQGAFSCVGLRNRVRALRAKHAKHWTRSGPNGRKRGQAR
jgi:hypothetical protein